VQPRESSSEKLPVPVDRMFSCLSESHGKGFFANFIEASIRSTLETQVNAKVLARSIMIMMGRLVVWRAVIVIQRAWVDRWSHPDGCR